MFPMVPRAPQSKTNRAPRMKMPWKWKRSAAVKGAVSKSSSLYANESWDSDSTPRKGRVSVWPKSKKINCPRGLKDKSRPEIEAFINEKKSERLKIQRDTVAECQTGSVYHGKSKGS